MRVSSLLAVAVPAIGGLSLYAAIVARSTSLELAALRPDASIGGDGGPKLGAVAPGQGLFGWPGVGLNTHAGNLESDWVYGPADSSVCVPALTLPQSLATNGTLVDFKRVEVQYAGAKDAGICDAGGCYCADFYFVLGTEQGGSSIIASNGTTGITKQTGSPYSSTACGAYGLLASGGTWIETNDGGEGACASFNVPFAVKGGLSATASNPYGTQSLLNGVSPSILATALSATGTLTITASSGLTSATSAELVCTQSDGGTYIVGLPITSIVSDVEITASVAAGTRIAATCNVVVSSSASPTPLTGALQFAASVLEYCTPEAGVYTGDTLVTCYANAGMSGADAAGITAVGQAGLDATIINDQSFSFYTSPWPYDASALPEAGAVAIADFAATPPLANAFTYIQPTPSISLLAPLAQATGGTVTITGVAINELTTCTIDGHAATMSAQTLTSAKLLVPSDATYSSPGSYEVEVAVDCNWSGGTITAGMYYLPSSVIHLYSGDVGLTTSSWTDQVPSGGVNLTYNAGQSDSGVSCTQPTIQTNPSGGQLSGIVGTSGGSQCMGAELWPSGLATATNMSVTEVINSTILSGTTKQFPNILWMAVNGSIGSASAEDYTGLSGSAYNMQGVDNSTNTAFTLDSGNPAAIRIQTIFDPSPNDIYITGEGVGFGASHPRTNVAYGLYVLGQGTAPVVGGVYWVAVNSGTTAQDNAVYATAQAVGNCSQ